VNQSDSDTNHDRLTNHSLTVIVIGDCTVTQLVRLRVTANGRPGAVTAEFCSLLVVNPVHE